MIRSSKYEFKPADFIPFKGLRTYVGRIVENGSIYEIDFNDNKKLAAQIGFGLLALYNLALIAAPIYGAIKGIESIVQ